MTSVNDITGSSSDEKIGRSEVVQFWLDEIGQALQREKTYREEGQKCVEIFEAEKREETPYNILYANTETLAPAVYNSLPRPVVKRRFKGENPTADWAGKILQRTLEFLADANSPGYDPFDDLLKSAVAEALVPGRGCLRFKYDPTFTSVPGEKEGAPAKEKVAYETVCGEEVAWNRVVFGYAKTWANTPWIAYEHFFTRQECVAAFGGEKGAAMKLTTVPQDAGDKGEQLPTNADGVKFAHVWEIWDKKTKKVIFVSDGDPDPIKEVDDPLKLSGFFSMPRPIGFLRRISSLVPKPLFSLYEAQAKELNDVTVRIGKITRALKVRGFYDSSIGGLDKLLEKDDNTLLPAENVAAMQQGQTLDKSIWLMPLNELAAVLQQLYTNRQGIKQVIYEITGIADILRGSSQASETLGAQKMKEAWGTMRLKRLQKEVQRFARDSLRIQAELAANHFSVETFQAMTGIMLPTAQQKEQAQMMMQQAQAAQQAGQQVPPQVMQQAQQLVQFPTWDEVVALLKDDVARNFVIDIETNSTIDAEATEDREQVTEYMTALGQLLAGLVPLVEKGFMQFEVSKQLLLTVTQRFRFGAEIEDTIRQMQAPQKQGGDPKAEAEAAKLKADVEFQRQRNQMELEKMQAQMELEQEKMQMERQKMQMEMELAQAKLQADLQKLSIQAQSAQVQGQIKTEMMANQAHQQEEQGAMQGAMMRQGMMQQAEQGSMKMEHADQQHQQRMAQQEQAVKQKPVGKKE